MSKPKLTATDCKWLIRLVEKDIAQNQELLEQNKEYPPRLFQLRIDNMRDVKRTLESMRESYSRSARAKADITREGR